MPNAITKFKNYTSLLDEVYQAAAKTAVLDSDPTLAKEGANANEIVIPKISMDGLGNYDRNSGYVTGDVTLTNETVAFNYERGRMFSVDAMDDEETAGVAYGKLSGEFIRTKVTPEIDAVRFAQYASTSGISSVTATYTTGEQVQAALIAASSQMDEDEVPPEDRHLFITPTNYDLIANMDTTKSKEVLKNFASITKVPQSRFYTAIDLKDGKTEGQTAGGFAKASTGVNINFLIIHKPALIQFTKHAAPKVVTPEANQDADAWKFGYRIYGLNDVYENKVAGIYLSQLGEPPVFSELDVTSAAGSVAVNDTVITVDPASAGTGNKYVYKLGTSSYTSFAYDDVLTTGWTDLAAGGLVAAGTSTKITVALVVSATGAARGRGIAALVKKTS